MNKLEIIKSILADNEETKPPTKIDDGIKIVILQRGWVVIGKYHQDGEYGVLTDAYVIRRWGTDEGLGQLAREGKQEETKLEKTGTIRFHELTSVAMIDCDEGKWKSEF